MEINYYTKINFQLFITGVIYVVYKIKKYDKDKCFT